MNKSLNSLFSPSLTLSPSCSLCVVWGSWFAEVAVSRDLNAPHEVHKCQTACVYSGHDAHTQTRTDVRTPTHMHTRRHTHMDTHTHTRTHTNANAHRGIKVSTKTHTISHTTTYFHWLNLNQSILSRYPWPKIGSTVVMEQMATDKSPFFCSLRI